jgi:N-acetylglucosamine-6-phosphate deacetylase
VEQILIGKILDQQSKEFRPGRVRLDGARIKAVEWGEFGPEDGAKGRPESFIAPGFIELQLNGGLGEDFTEKPEAVYPVAAALPRWGVTSFLPTVITSTDETYLHALKVIGEAQGKVKGAKILGVHLEGPFLNPQYRGAHNPTWLQTPVVAKIKAALETGPLRLLTLAPELPNATEVIGFAAERGVLVSMGHSGATYEQAEAGRKAGARYATHLFNAMPPLHHRNPGLIGAVLATPEVTAGIIVDGIHLHPAIVKMIWQAKGVDHLNLVTDAMAGMGMPPGNYQLSGQHVIVDETSARLENGTLAGSILTLDQAVRNMQEWTGCSLAEALQMVTLNPARLLGLENKGQIRPGFDADLVVLNGKGEVELTLVAGQVAFENSIAAI